MSDINSFQEYLKKALDQIELTPTDPSPETESYDINEEIRTLIIQTRLNSGMTQQQLANSSGISQANISRIENGKMRPSLDVLKKLADGLGLRLRITFENQEVDE